MPKVSRHGGFSNGPGVAERPPHTVDADVHVAGALTAAGVLTARGAVIAAGAVTVSGDLSHDGTSVGFHGTTPVAQAAHVTDASTAHALAVIFNDTEVETALNALGTKINDLLDILEAYGLMAGA